MDFKLNGLLSRYVLVLMLLEVQWRLVFPALTHTSCDHDLQNTKYLTEQLRHEAVELLGEYIKLHGHAPANGSVPDDVPDPTISGVNISEKLQDIYTKGVLFHWHISKVEEYQRALWGSPGSVAGPLGRVKGGLSNHLFKIKTMLAHINPEEALPTTPATPQLSHPHYYVKKAYGWGVMGTLRDWLTKVLQVLEEAMEVCAKQRIF